MIYSKVILAFLILNSTYFLAQKKCTFEINIERILKNENLDKFLSYISKNDFKTLTKKQEIQNFILSDLDCISGGFSIANVTEKFQNGCVGDLKQPKRKLLFLSKSRNIVVMTYAINGFASTTKILFIEFNSKHIIDIWTGFGNRGLNTNRKILNFIIKNRGVKNVLNSKTINI